MLERIVRGLAAVLMALSIAARAGGLVVAALVIRRVP